MITWHVYQFRSDTELLYVGYSRVLKRRIGQHRREKPWWPEVTDVVAEEFATEDEARQREKEVWASERPKYNRNSPFVTPEEERARNASYVPAHKRSAEALDRRRRQQREHDKTPARRAQNRKKKQSAAYKAWAKDYMREYNRTYRPRGWQQTGPGLF